MDPYVIDRQTPDACGQTLIGVGVVVIGRNEGERLTRCFATLPSTVGLVVYVDSGSTDGSVVNARARGVSVVELDMRTPFTAARARNAGFECAIQSNPGLRYIQFVDGDCELQALWVEKASSFLESRPDIAVVSGRLREKYPDASVYNMLCDIEWSAPAGEARMCGGIAMMRVDVMKQVNGFNAALICGEEPELCSRMRTRGWRIWRLADDMGWHDANMTRFSQWWVRSVRSGYSDVQAVVVDGAPPERRGMRASLRAWFWGAWVPLACVILAVFWKPAGLFLLLAYPLQIVRLALRGRRTPRENWLHATFLMLGKFPEVQGQVKYLLQHLIGQQSQLIEHK